MHRLNQTRDVVVYKLTIANTVEARILALQEKKRALAEAAIEGKAVGKLSLKDILNLFRRDAEEAHHDDDNVGGVQGGLGVKVGVLRRDEMDVVGSGEGGVAGGKEREREREKVSERGGGAAREESVWSRKW